MPRLVAGRLNQSEYSERTDPILASETGEKEHYHNQLLAAIYGNVTREMPDQGLAPWVSANDKPTTTTGTKPVSGDAAERRLKGEVMQLPSRDRRRIKDLMQNDVGCLELAVKRTRDANLVSISSILTKLLPLYLQINKNQKPPLGLQMCRLVQQQVV